MPAQRSDDSCAVSVVVPVYGCAWALSELCQRLTDVMTGAGDTFEVVLIDDRATDGSWQIIEKLAQEDERIKGVLLSRNFGQQAAITAGLAEACGRAVVVMDCDLQDPPEFVPQLVKRLREGADIVLAKRRSQYDSVLRRIGNRIYFLVLSKLAGVRLDGSFGSFSALSRKAVDAFARFRDRDRHYLFILQWLGFHTAHLEYERHQRPQGTSAHSLGALIRLAIEGIFFQTSVFLKWVVYAGLCVGAIGLLLEVLFIVLYFKGSPPPGWTSMIVVSLMLGGVTIVSVGIVGLYVARIFEQTKDRPLYVIDRRTSNRVTATP